MGNTRWVNNIEADYTYKSRLVMQGQPQVPGIDCGGTFSPVCRLQSIRMMLVVAAKPDYVVFMLGIQTTFLNADVEKDVLAKMSPSYEIARKSHFPIVMELNTSLYGLRQSPKNWLGTIDYHLAKVGLRLLKSDPCIYV
ncbi:unnamed protein product [Sphacelaria rigidula]